jgi:hypothetical protein
MHQGHCMAHKIGLQNNLLISRILSCDLLIIKGMAIYKYLRRDNSQITLVRVLPPSPHETRLFLELRLGYQRWHLLNTIICLG